MNSVIKLIGRAKRLENDKISTTIYPAIVPQHSQLASVDDVYNAIMVRGDAIGDVVFYGRGAGKLPTASAVVADVIDCSKHFNTRKYVFWSDGDKDYVSDYKKDEYPMYVRMLSVDVKTLKSEIKQQFGSVTFLSKSNAPGNELAFVTNEIEENSFDEKMLAINGKVASKIRVLNSL